MQKKDISWGIIFIALIVFWPVGLFLVFQKFSADKSALMSGRTKTLTVIAWVLIAIGALALIANRYGEFPEREFTPYVALFLIGGALLLRKAKNVKKTATQYRKYIELVVNQNIRSIDYIVSAVGLPYDKVVSDLQKMIDIGYLKDAYIHVGNRTIEFKQTTRQPAFTPAPDPSQIFSDMAPGASNRAYTQVYNQSRNSENLIPVRCPDCGAKNVVPAGKVQECEYCGNPIKA